MIIIKKISHNCIKENQGAPQITEIPQSEENSTQKFTKRWQNIGWRRRGEVDQIRDCKLSVISIFSTFYKNHGAIQYIKTVNQINQ